MFLFFSNLFYRYSFKNPLQNNPKWQVIIIMMNNPNQSFILFKITLTQFTFCNSENPTRKRNYCYPNTFSRTLIPPKMQFSYSWRKFKRFTTNKHMKQISEPECFNRNI